MRDGGTREVLVMAAVFCGAIACGQASKPAADDPPAAETDVFGPCPTDWFGICQPDEPVACGPTVCPAGQVCCNASCGICAPPDGVCTQQVCEPPPSGGACARDADCRTFSDYCTGCDCRALSTSERDPVCPGPGVQCFVDPCTGQEAFCAGGRCALRVPAQPCP